MNAVFSVVQNGQVMAFCKSYNLESELLLAQVIQAMNNKVGLTIRSKSDVTYIPYELLKLSIVQIETKP